jgi:hypothetical protein
VNVNPTLRALTLMYWGLFILTTAGCARWVEMMPTPTDGQDAAAQTIATDERVPLLMDRVRTTRNGSPQNPSADTEQRILGSFADTGLFSHLAATNSVAPASAEKVIRARLLFDEAIDPHAGSAAWKGIVISASMYLLTPFLALEYDYAAHMILELERWDGQIKRYESQSAGTARYQLFGATPIMIDELKGHVTESCLTELNRQIVRDTTFYAASSAPLSESGIRTISVKSILPKVAGSLSPAIPISIPSEP